jgi:hypothetical protein
MTKSTIRGNLSIFAPDIQASAAQGLDYVLGETNSYSCHVRIILLLRISMTDLAVLRVHLVLATPLVQLFGRSIMPFKRMSNRLRRPGKINEPEFQEHYGRFNRLFSLGHWI